MRFPIFSKPKNPEGSVMPKVESKKDTSVTLTPLGKTKAEQFSLEGPRFDILASLLEDGTQSIGEISAKTGHSANKVKEVCRSLATSGYIKFIKVQQ